VSYDVKNMKKHVHDNIVFSVDTFIPCSSYGVAESNYCISNEKLITVFFSSYISLYIYSYIELVIEFIWEL